MLSKNANTIEQHLELVGSRFQLAQLVMKRTKQLMKGSQINISVGKVGTEFNPKKRSDIPNHLYPKIALEEIRQEKLHWKRTSDKTPADIPLIEGNPVVFGE